MMASRSFWSEPLERRNGHKAKVGKTEENTCLHERCWFRSSGHTDFQALIINSVGDVENEVGYLH